MVNEVQVVQYRPEHLVKLKLKMASMEEKPPSVNTYAVTFMRGSEPIAIFGSFCPTLGVSHIWGLVSEEVYKIPKTFFQTVKNYLTHIERTEQFRRIQIDVREDFVEGNKFAQALGFKLEARLNHYNPDGSNAMLYARTY